MRGFEASWDALGGSPSPAMSQGKEEVLRDHPLFLDKIR